MRRWIVLSAALALFGLAGCSPEFFANQVEERQGNINVVFINDTRSRAAFSFGTYDDADRDPPGAVTLQQLRVEAQTISAVAAVPCRRDLAIATAAFVQRVTDTGADDVAGFDPDSFDSVIHFSDAPATSDAAALPTAGTLDGLRLRLGVDYTCGAQVFIIFSEDDAGVFSATFRVLPVLEADR